MQQWIVCFADGWGLFIVGMVGVNCCAVTYCMSCKWLTVGCYLCILQVLECLKQAMQPALVDLVMEFDTPAGVTCLTIPPNIPADVFPEEKLAVYLLFRGEVST